MVAVEMAVVVTVKALGRVMVDSRLLQAKEATGDPEQVVVPAGFQKILEVETAQGLQ